MKKQIMILTHPLCRIYLTDTNHELEITVQDGSVIRHQPFPPDQAGLVAAVSLAAEILAGKFWLNKVISSPMKTNLIENNQTKGLKNVST